MPTSFYFPTSLKEGFDCLSGKLPIQQICQVVSNSLVGYTSRTIALEIARKNRKEGDESPLCLVVVEIEKRTLDILVRGDFAHHGPCISWQSEHTVLLEHYAQAWLQHEGRFRLELFRG